MKTFLILYMYYGLVAVVAILRNSYEKEIAEKKVTNVIDFLEIDDSSLGLFVCDTFWRIFRVICYIFLWPMLCGLKYASFHVVISYMGFEEEYE